MHTAGGGGGLSRSRVQIDAIPGIMHLQWKGVFYRGLNPSWNLNELPEEPHAESNAHRRKNIFQESENFFRFSVCKFRSLNCLPKLNFTVSQK